MKTILISIFSVLILGGVGSLHAQKVELTAERQSVNENIEVYYFHFTNRCLTCNAVESETKIALKNYFSEELNNGKITFTSLNLDNKEGKKIADRLKIAGQSLLIVQGDKKIDLTSQGFMQARSNPEKLHEIIKTKIDDLL